jgi:hypothetical protein
MAHGPVLIDVIVALQGDLIAESSFGPKVFPST